MVFLPPTLRNNPMEYLVLTKQISDDHYTFAKFFNGEDEVIDHIKSTPQDKFQRDIRVISESNLKVTHDFDDEDLIDTYIDVRNAATIDEENE
jgi:hypothetical protein